MVRKLVIARTSRSNRIAPSCYAVGVCGGEGMLDQISTHLLNTPQSRAHLGKSHTHHHLLPGSNEDFHGHREEQLEVRFGEAVLPL